jgi:hypothetical protein
MKAARTRRRKEKLQKILCFLSSLRLSVKASRPLGHQPHRSWFYRNFGGRVDSQNLARRDGIVLPGIRRRISLLSSATASAYRNAAGIDIVAPAGIGHETTDLASFAGFGFLLLFLFFLFFVAHIWDLLNSTSLRVDIFSPVGRCICKSTG